MTAQKDLFTIKTMDHVRSGAMPLAARMRPRVLDEYVGQEHILAQGKLLRRAIDSDRITSLILYGPPGVGKTALVHIISSATEAEFENINAVCSNVAQLRSVIAKARERRNFSTRRTILFIDEIHRFNKAQQDVLMPDIEQGNIILIGATTHNPFFSLVSPILSRSLVFELKPLEIGQIKTVLQRALNDTERGFGKMPVQMYEEALDHISRLCDGDARRALNALEIGVLTTKTSSDKKIHFTLEVAEESIQKKMVVYDKDEDGHYDVASAFIKSMRGSDPDAALYWLAKMLYAGEDPRFIARRIVICAAEDVGNADPMALVLANSAMQISEFVGLPECKIPLAQAVTYIATAPKSNAAYMGIESAQEDVKNNRTYAVPEHLKDTHYKGAEKLGHGEGYKYAHSYEGNFVAQEYFGGTAQYYNPTENGHEKIISERLKKWRAMKQQQNK